jgi:hypothetical protein
MRVVSSRQEAIYRRYRIEGTKKGECISLQVIATRPHLPSLDYSLFLAMPRCKWPKAVEVVCGYIDQALGHLRSVPQNENVEVEKSAVRAARYHHRRVCR